MHFFGCPNSTGLPLKSYKKATKKLQKSDKKATKRRQKNRDLEKSDKTWCSFWSVATPACGAIFIQFGIRDKKFNKPIKFDAPIFFFSCDYSSNEIEFRLFVDGYSFNYLNIFSKDEFFLILLKSNPMIFDYAVISVGKTPHCGRCGQCGRARFLRFGPRARPRPQDF